ncbi:hypothetical protein [Rheinheimera sp. 4Y26]|uniref:hypothetical protein n=1 Tax=Rheinheimera sp. 4Y26 TaxID=2977811 RepID=UPI0021B158DF|nr:hypothetical protein [Rheinheimera sp. 4Y26]MCT6700016.1 hypothetical protein [Rheinheimera sp. 4Y26]
MALTISSYLQSAQSSQLNAPLNVSASQSTTQATTQDTTQSTASASNRSSESERYTAVQQSQANAKTAISAASSANKDIGNSLKQVREVATQLADDSISSKEREKLQADYQKLRENIVASQDKATVKTGDNKTNLLRDDKNMIVSTNTKGGELEVASSKSAKGLLLPEKITSSAQARALLDGNEQQAGSLANAEKVTSSTASRLKEADKDISSRLETSTAVAKSVQQLENAKNGSGSLSAEKEQQKEKALEFARAAAERIKSQLEGLSGGNNKNNNSLLSLFS